MFGFLQSVSSITAEEVKRALENKADVIVIDVRTREEYSEGHINGSILLPVDTVHKKIVSIIPDKNKIVYVHCRSGTRSKRAVKIMEKMGYTNIFNMQGGFLAWEQLGLPVKK